MGQFAPISRYVVASRPAIRLSHGTSAHLRQTQRPRDNEAVHRPHNHQQLEMIICCAGTASGASPLFVELCRYDRCRSYMQIDKLHTMRTATLEERALPARS
ncbi:hypothetical protein AOQ72_16280 [Bradyrhizobium yuanmingense]|uniref:Uncharacterized protein n=1 Tax=Bradyrhizobium yuanmingense TaxID=108015 RepID=A0A0R3CMI5_9BRAD|nr:hypothetical protein AOQ72_16280 [Bradyrhizobium yuanmingense]